MYFDPIHTLLHTPTPPGSSFPCPPFNSMSMFIAPLITNPLTLISVVHVPIDVGPSTGVWSNHQGPLA